MTSDRNSDPKSNISEIEQIAAQQADYKAKAARWSIEIAIFLFALLVAIIILIDLEVSSIVVSFIAAISLALVWLIAWQNGKKLYKRIYDEELRRLRLEINGIVENSVVEDLEEQVRKALRKRWEE
ncbi:hypothetical protein ACFLVJ_02135 [Chloroflexota bacterium]